jgi:predicted AAA+ superfamily ATPase
MISDVDIARHKIDLMRFLDEYAEWGGFPEVVLSSSVVRRRELLTRYFEDIVIKDVVRRFGIKEFDKLERLANILVANIATLQSYNKLKVPLATSVHTVERFSKYLEISRMFFFLKKFDYSAGRQMRSINKVYVTDPGLYTVKGFRFSENAGRVAENLVAVELLRKRSLNPQLELYYWRNYQQQEVDFVVKEGARVKQLIQVCWDVSNERTRRRETSALLKAGTDMKCNDLLIVTNNYEAEETIKRNGVKKTVRFLPLWRWLLTPTDSES